MQPQPTYLNVLSLSPYGKAIPYTGNATRQDNKYGNYGFKNLKAQPELIHAVPELVTDSALKSLVQSLNAQESSFFSVGCFSDPVQTGQGHRYKGYVDFSWNCKKCVQDAINYFSLFFHFEQFLRHQKFQQAVKLDWVVEQAQFLDVNIHGFCCAIFINTPVCASVEQAYAIWRRALHMLEAFLSNIQRPSSSTIYSSATVPANALTT